ncbi:MAG: tRNA adenosine(34) deaminase TadA [Desulfobacterales bacterium]
MKTSDDVIMAKALTLAESAGSKGEVPVGAVLVSENGRILASAHNRVIMDCDPTAHAEILALREAAKKVMNYRLNNTTLFVTIEPCVMCMGAIIHARVKRVVFGAADPKWGACGSLYDLAGDPKFNHRMEVIGGVCEAQCRSIIQDFFRKRRNGLDSVGYKQH